jgi:hypothetical protein
MFHPNPLRNETTIVTIDIHAHTHTDRQTYTLLTNQNKHPKDFGSLTILVIARHGLSNV